LAAIYILTENGTPLPGVPYSGITITPPEVATLNERLSNRETNPDGSLDILVDTTQTTGSFNITIFFDQFGVQNGDCGAFVMAL